MWPAVTLSHHQAKSSCGRLKTVHFPCWKCDMMVCRECWLRRKQLNEQGCQNITEDESAGLCSGLSRHHSCGVSLTRTQRDYANCPHLQILQSVQTEKPSCHAPTTSADSNGGSMVLHIVQIQFIGAREAECVPTHTAEKHRGSYSGVRLEEEWRSQHISHSQYNRRADL